MASSDASFHLPSLNDGNLPTHLPSPPKKRLIESKKEVEIMK